MSSCVTSFLGLSCSNHRHSCFPLPSMTLPRTCDEATDRSLRAFPVPAGSSNIGSPGGSAPDLEGTGRNHSALVSGRTMDEKLDVITQWIEKIDPHSHQHPGSHPGCYPQHIKNPTSWHLGAGSAPGVSSRILAFAWARWWFHCFRVPRHRVCGQQQDLCDKNSTRIRTM